MPTERFASKAGYMRNLAYRHLHNIPMTASRVCIGKGEHARCHEVQHSRNPKRMAIDARQRRKVARRAHRREENRRRGGRR